MTFREPDRRRFMDLAIPEYAYMFGFLQADGHLAKGTGQKKSRTIAPPRVVFARHDYVRGLIDGDGSVGFTGKGHPFLGLTTASTAIAAYVCDYGAEATGVERNVQRTARDGMYNVLWTNEAAQRLAAGLYYPGCLALERKRAAARSVAAWRRPEGMRAAYTPRRWSPDEDRVLLSVNSPTAAAAALGRTMQSCNLRLWRLRTGQVPPPA